MSSFKHVCECLATKNLWESGVELKEIARQTDKSPSTVNEWILTAYGGNPCLKAQGKGCNIKAKPTTPLRRLPKPGDPVMLRGEPMIVLEIVPPQGNCASTVAVRDSKMRVWEVRKEELSKIQA